MVISGIVSAGLPEGGKRILYYVSGKLRVGPHQPRTTQQFRERMVGKSES